jgi:hypothetical protein
MQAIDEKQRSEFANQNANNTPSQYQRNIINQNESKEMILIKLSF